MYVAGQPCHCIKTAAKPRADADAAIRGFCQDQAANNMRWETDYCQSQVDTVISADDCRMMGMAQPLEHQQPYLAVPRDALNTAELAGMVKPGSLVSVPNTVYRQDAATVRPVRTEVELLREKLAAAEALIEAMTPPPAAPVPNPIERALSRWPGSVGVIQGLRWRA
jgi:hypothetical protein